MTASHADQPRCRLGVIGVGSMGFNHVRMATELAKVGTVEVVGITDANAQRCAQVAQHFGVPAMASVEALLDARPDGVMIAVSTKAHLEIALKVLHAGVGTLIEKPIAATVAEAERIIAAGKEADRPVLVGHVERFNPAVETTKRRLEGEEVISISITRVGPFPQGIGDVGVVLDLGVHDIDLIEHLAGAPIRDVYALTRSGDGKVEDTALLQFRTENGILASINTNWITPFKLRQLEVATTEKFVRTDLMGQVVDEMSHYDTRGAFTVQPIPVPRAEPLRKEIEHFVACLQGTETPLVPAEAGLRALAVAQDCLR